MPGAGLLAIPGGVCVVPLESFQPVGELARGWGAGWCEADECGQGADLPHSSQCGVATPASKVVAVFVGEPVDSFGVEAEASCGIGGREVDLARPDAD